MRLRVCLLPLALLLALAQQSCGQAAPPPSPPPPSPPPAAPAPAPPAAEKPAPPPAQRPVAPAGKGEVSGLSSHLAVRWDEGPPVARLRIEFTVENIGTEAVTVGFSNSGRVCGVVYDADGREVNQFPQITAQVMGEEAFRSGEPRLFRYEIPRAELGEPPSASYTVEVWLCGQRGLRQQSTAKVPSP